MFGQNAVNSETKFMLKPHTLLTGINGFVGKHLANLLLKHGRNVYGIDIQEKCMVPGVTYFQMNICDHDSVRRICEQVKPAEIYHLAGVASPSGFHLTPNSSFQINIMGTISMLDAMRTVSSNAVILLVGSSTEYNACFSESGFSEKNPLEPTSFYGVSKYVSEIIGQYYVRHHNLNVCFTRSFNHTGPGQSPSFVCSDWARQVAEIEVNNAVPEISIGDINNTIDFSDVRDVVDAYRLIMEKGKKGEPYNVCSGKGVNLEYILHYLLAKSSSPISIRVQTDKVSGQNTHTGCVGENRKLRQETGWSPAIPIEKTLDDLYEWWVKELEVKKY